MLVGRLVGATAGTDGIVGMTLFGILMQVGIMVGTLLTGAEVGATIITMETHGIIMIEFIEATHAAKA